MKNYCPKCEYEWASVLNYVHCPECFTPLIEPPAARTIEQVCNAPAGSFQEFAAKPDLEDGQFKADPKTEAALDAIAEHRQRSKGVSVGEYAAAKPVEASDVERIADKWWYKFSRVKVSADEAIRGAITEAITAKDAEVDEWKRLYDVSANTVREQLAEIAALKSLPLPIAAIDQITRQAEEIAALKAKIAESSVNCPSCGRHDFGLVGPVIEGNRKLKADVLLYSGLRVALCNLAGLDGLPERIQAGDSKLIAALDDKLDALKAERDDWQKLAKKFNDAALDFPCGHKPNYVTGNCEICQCVELYTQTKERYDKK